MGRGLEGKGFPLPQSEDNEQYYRFLLAKKLGNRKNKKKVKDLIESFINSGGNRRGN